MNYTLNIFSILICDVNIKEQGHYISYNQYIINNILKTENKYPNVSISFLFNIEAKSLLTFPEALKDKVSFIEINNKNTLLTRFKTTKKIVSFCKATHIDHLLFMDFDQYQLSLFFTRSRFRISGILFRPHHRIKASKNEYRRGIISYLKRIKKKFAEKLIVGKRNIGHIFILNDIEGVKILNKIHRSSVFKYLPDPVFSYNEGYYSSPLNKSGSEFYRFLIFGSINERKNISNIIKAYNVSRLAYQSELLIVGPAKEKYSEYLQELIFSLNNIDFKHKKVLIQSKFVSNSEMDSLFSSSDVCLLIYKDFYGSSGILGRAALNKLKVIGPNIGLINELIKKYDLGITSDPNDIVSISQAIEIISDHEVNPSGFEDYYNHHSPDMFFNSLLESVL